jgi:hypothetical protein
VVSNGLHPCLNQNGSAAAHATSHGPGGHHAKRSRRAGMTPEEFTRWWARAGRHYRDIGDLLRD